jgi:hypothetical protein
MMRGHGVRRGLRAAGLTALTLLVGGCFGSSPPSRYYLLTPIEPPPDAAVGPPPGSPADERTLLLANVALPAYLSDSSIVTRVDGNRLEVAGLDRWGEPLRDNVTRVLARNLQLLLPEHAVVVHPWERPPRATRTVEVAVTRFDVEGGRAVLSARWQVGREGALVRRRSEIATPVPAGGEEDAFAAIAAAMSDALATLSREIADAVEGP